MKSTFKNTKAVSPHIKRGSGSTTKQTKVYDLTAVESLSTGEMNLIAGGNTFREMERVLTFDHGYPHKD